MRDIIKKIEENQEVDIYDGSIREMSDFMKDSDSWDAHSYGRHGMYWTDEEEELYVKVRSILNQIGHWNASGEVVVIDHKKVISRNDKWVIPITI